MRGNHFLVHGHKKDLPQITCIFHLLKYVVKNVLMSAILHHISLQRILPKSHFRKNTFQPNFLCSSSFKVGFAQRILIVLGECSIEKLTMLTSYSKDTWLRR